MSIKQNITSLQNLLEQVNALPDSGSGDGSVESCKIQIITNDTFASPVNPTIYYTDATTLTLKSITTQSSTITVPINSIIAITGWNPYSESSGFCS